MTDSKSGLLGSLWLCATVDGTYVKLGELSDMKLKIDGKEIDTTNVDDAGWTSKIAGAKSAEVTNKSNLLMNDAGYALLKTAINSADMTIYAKILQSGTPTSSPVGNVGKFLVSAPSYTLVSLTAQQSLDFTLKNVGQVSEIT